MLSFWARYVILKEQNGQSRDVTLQQIEEKFGVEKRQEIEHEIVVELGEWCNDIARSYRRCEEIKT